MPPFSPTSAHDDVLNGSPRPSFDGTLHSFDDPSSEKPLPLKTIKLSPTESCYRPLSPCCSDADEQTLVDESRSFISTQTIPIQPNPIQSPLVSKTSRHAGAMRRNIMNRNCLMNTFFIIYFSFISMGLGSVFGLCNISLGCLTRKSSMETCRKLGAAGGAFASIPTGLTVLLTWYIYDILHNRNSSPLSWVSISPLLVILPLICFGFSFLTAFIGWHILDSMGSVDFDLHRAFVFGAIGSACTFVFYSFTLGMLIVHVDGD